VADEPAALLGYKAVSKEHGESAIERRELHRAKRDEANDRYHWLGDGIYFYPELKDAESYLSEKGPGAFVISAKTVLLEREEIIDLGHISDSDRRNKITDYIETLAGKRGIEIAIGTEPSFEKNRHIFAEIMWENYRNAKVLKASFWNLPSDEFREEEGKHARYLREEYCVRWGEYIDSDSIKRIG